MKRKLFFIIALACCLVLAVGILAACNDSGSSGQQTPGGEDPGTETPGDNPGGEDPGDETVSFTVTFDTQGGSALADITVENGQVIGEFTLPTKQCSRLVGFALDTAGEQMWNVLTDTVSANITLYAIWEDAHTWGEWADTTPATCTENGERTRECEVCGVTESEVIPASHIWGEWTETIAPGCETEGERSHSCEVCGKTENEAIDALGHDYSEEYTEDVAPTCENPGSESRHCTRCDATTDSRDINALGHDTSSVEWISDSENHWKICARCNNKTEMAAHDFGTTGICVCGVIEDTPLGEFTFTSLSNNRWEVTKYIGTRSIVVIPSEYEGGAVTSIGNAAFLGCTGLTSITIPDSVTSIGDFAFSGCSGLTSITIPDSVTSIGWYAFSGCTSLTSVTIPDSVTSIGIDAFSGCTGLTSIVVEEGNPVYHSDGNCLIETASKTLVVGCKTSVIPNDGSVTSIGSSAFYGCSGLTSVTIPDSVTSIGDYAFRGCSGLTSITIPDSVTSIGGSAFEGCTGLTSVTIPDSVTSIGSSAFYGCSGLTSVTIPNSVTSIGNYAFQNCYKLIEVHNKSSLNITAGSSGNGYVAYYAKNVYTEEGGSWFTDTADGFRFFYDGTDGYLMGYYGEETAITLPDGFTAYDGTEVTEYAIYDYAFRGCSGLTSVTIPDSVTSIGSSAFYGCTGLTEIYYTGDVASWCGISGLGNIMSSGRTLYIGGEEVEGDLVIPDSVTSIGSYAFRGCSGLTSVTIPDSVTSIGSSAFYGCTGLTSITIPDSVTSIGHQAFRGCSGLTSVTIPDSVTSIGSSAFYGCTGLTSITIPDSVTSIGHQAFYGCYKLIEVYNKSSLDITAGNSGNGYVAYYAENVYTEEGGSWFTDTADGFRFFYDGTDGYLIGYYGEETALSLPDGFTAHDGTKVAEYAIYDYAFEYCTGLTSVTIGNSVTSIGGFAFSGCSGLTSITIPDSVTSIGSRAFYNCTGLTSVTIGNGVTSIGDYAFNNCGGLDAVYITDLSAWCGIWFHGNSATANPLCYAHNLYLNGELVTDLVIPDGVTSIGDYAFYNCAGLTSVTIPDSVTSIGEYAFRGCSGLTSVTFENTSGWYRASSSTATSGTSLSSSSLSNPSTAARWLTSTYVSYYWKRK